MGCAVATRDKTTVLVSTDARIVYFTQSSFNAVVCCFEFTLWVGFTTFISPSTWGNQRGVRDPHRIKPISGAVAGDSSLQDRGVAHYLLSLIFSLVSLPFSFYFSVPYQKYQKLLLLC